MSNIDKTIQDLFSKLQQRKNKVNELKASIAKNWKTNGTFRLLGASSTTNIQTATAAMINEVAVQLCIITNAQSQAAQRLGQEVSFKVQGYSADDWFDDFKKRLAVIDLRAEEEHLVILENRLNQVLSPEQRRAMEVELLSKEFAAIDCPADS